MLAIEALDDVTRVVMSTRTTRAIGYSVSAYLVRGVLVDLGFAAVGREVAAYLDHAQPRGVILTHHHEDHAGNVELAVRGGLPLAASDATLAALRAAPPLDTYRRITWGTPPRLVSAVRPFVCDALCLVPAPGHSHDHHVVWDAERETLFGGDLFLGIKVRIAHEGEDPRRLVASLRAAAALHPRRLFDAHRGLVRDPVDALLAKAEWMEETMHAIEARIHRGWSDRAITRDVLGREPLEHHVSRGKLSKINFVRAVRAGIHR
ncbi:MAG: MBL fold metallo-hydrolase [Gemmatimonadaceae bacterium]|nr:MBL fold metallo-hydrolase [Gemmatimonadaceae bacterium]